MLEKLTQFFAKNNVISNASGFIIALNLSEFINSLVKDILIPGLLPFKETTPLYAFLSSLISLILVIFIVYILLGEIMGNTMGLTKVKEMEKVKDKITEKVVEKEVEKNPNLYKKMVNNKLNRE
jgi:large-conductance mechanosensitive channel